MKQLALIIAVAIALPACQAAKSTPTASLAPAPTEAGAPDPAARSAIDAGLASPRFRTVDDFTLEAITYGEDFTLSSALSEGRWVALHFLLKTDCPLCLTYTMRFHEAASQTPDVTHVFIKPDEPDIAQRWVRLARFFTDNQVPTIHRDPGAALAKQLDVKFGHPFHGEITHYPCLVLIDPQGRQRWRYTGTSTFERATVGMYTDACERFGLIN